MVLNLRSNYANYLTERKKEKNLNGREKFTRMGKSQTKAFLIFRTITSMAYCNVAVVFPLFLTDELLWCFKHCTSMKRHTKYCKGINNFFEVDKLWKRMKKYTKLYKSKNKKTWISIQKIAKLIKIWQIMHNCGCIYQIYSRHWIFSVVVH